MVLKLLIILANWSRSFPNFQTVTKDTFIISYLWCDIYLNRNTSNIMVSKCNMYIPCLQHLSSHFSYLQNTICVLRSSYFHRPGFWQGITCKYFFCYRHCRNRMIVWCHTTNIYPEADSKNIHFAGHFFSLRVMLFSSIFMLLIIFLCGELLFDSSPQWAWWMCDWNPRVIDWLFLNKIFNTSEISTLA